MAGNRKRKKSVSKPEQREAFGSRELAACRTLNEDLVKIRNTAAGLIGEIRLAKDPDLELATEAHQEAMRVQSALRAKAEAMRTLRRRVEREMDLAENELKKAIRDASDTVREVKSHAMTAGTELERRRKRLAEQQRAEEARDRATGRAPAAVRNKRTQGVEGTGGNSTPADPAPKGDGPDGPDGPDGEADRGTPETKDQGATDHEAERDDADDRGDGGGGLDLVV